MQPAPPPQPAPAQPGMPAAPAPAAPPEAPALPLLALLLAELLDELLSSCAASGNATKAVIAKLANSFFINLVLLQKYKFDIPQFF